MGSEASADKPANWRPWIKRPGIGPLTSLTADILSHYQLMRPTLYLEFSSIFDGIIESIHESYVPVIHPVTEEKAPGYVFFPFA